MSENEGHQHRWMLVPAVASVQSATRTAGTVCCTSLVDWLVGLFVLCILLTFPGFDYSRGGKQDKLLTFESNASDPLSPLFHFSNRFSSAFGSSLSLSHRTDGPGRRRYRLQDICGPAAASPLRRSTCLPAGVDERGKVGWGQKIKEKRKANIARARM